jgi:hypothetical protein
MLLFFFKKHTPCPAYVSPDVPRMLLRRQYGLPLLSHFVSYGRSIMVPAAAPTDLVASASKMDRKIFDLHSL